MYERDGPPGVRLKAYRAVGNLVRDVRADQPFRRAGRNCVKPESRKNKKTGLLRAERIYIFLSVLFFAR